MLTEKELFQIIDELEKRIRDARHSRFHLSEADEGKPTLLALGRATPVILMRSEIFHQLSRLRDRDGESIIHYSETGKVRSIAGATIFTSNDIEGPFEVFVEPKFN